MMRARRAFTDRYFWRADGRASARVLDAAAAYCRAGHATRATQST
jgi:hypothetical protein